MATKATWAGSISFGGFPLPVKVFPILNGRKNPSFKMLDPKHKKPVVQQLVDVEGNVVNRAETGRGYEVSKSDIRPLSDEALELIENVGRSTVVEPESFPSLDTIDLDLSLAVYSIVPDDKVPGSADSLQILWNGLRKTNRAAVIDGWASKANSRPSTLVIHATEDGLQGNLLPFLPEVNRVFPIDFAPEVNDKQAELAAQVIESMFSTEDFDIERYRDTYMEKRQAAINLALSGEALPEVSKPQEPAAQVPDLMAALQAKLAEKDAKPKPKSTAKKPQVKKPTSASRSRPRAAA